jgi:hypothetical protein
MLFVELVKVDDSWLLHSGMIDNKTELELGYFGRLLVERVRGKMENIVSGGQPIA